MEGRGQQECAEGTVNFNISFLPNENGETSAVQMGRGWVYILSDHLLIVHAGHSAKPQFPPRDDGE
jgi:hypothetical protein